MAGAPCAYLESFAPEAALAVENAMPVLCQASLSGMWGGTEGAPLSAVCAAFSPPPLTGIILAVLTAVVLFGGAKRIGWTASVLVPVSAGLYLLAGGIAVFSFYDQIPEVLGNIVGGAFGLADNAGQTAGSSILNFSGISGGMTGYGMAAAIRSGVSRGVFSNEAGLGSLAVLHGMSEGKGRLRQRQEAQKQGMWAIFEVFFDTIIGCSLTAFLLLCVFPHNLTEKIDSSGGSGAVAAALAARFGNAGGIVTAACMVLFAFATILAWFYIGDQALGWLMGVLSEACRQNMYFVSRRLSLPQPRLRVNWMEAARRYLIFSMADGKANLAALVQAAGRVRSTER